ncbi:MAG: 2OG-Fe(II) oxygenase [Gammaproteobacteria bacterium]|mgnify:CR=1 FL=1|nr:2OG-Fe(II) oxygenase [Gammaproteobacteria bacterium]|tara:strand:- start:1169 stop:1771 length:603 start_codon:yes stop_codon:yes gene_type:complete
MKRINLEGPDPHFIGCWDIEQNSLCDELVNFFESHEEKHEAGKSAGGVDLEAKSSIDIAVHPRDLKTDEYKIIKGYIDFLFVCYKDYTEQFPFLGSILPNTDIGSFNIQKYLPGGHFKLPHSERTSIQNSFRALAWMSYLNDVEDGGTTIFTHQNMEVKPEKGKTLIWPAEWTHAHAGNIVNSGEKYIITGWMHFPHEAR